MKTTLNDATEKRLCSTLGLCAKAGKLIYGVALICEALKRGKSNIPFIVLEASDTSENTHKRINDRCKYYGIRHFQLNTSAEKLAASVGKSSPLAAVGITDRQLSRAIDNLLPEDTSENIE